MRNEKAYYVYLQHIVVKQDPTPLMESGTMTEGVSASLPSSKCCQSACCTVKFHSIIKFLYVFTSDVLNKEVSRKQD